MGEIEEAAMAIRHVWAKNLEEEWKLVEAAAMTHQYVAVDTEFPGFRRSSPRNANQEEKYGDLKFNVDSMKLIQVGIAFFDDGVDRPACWEFNLKDFNPAEDVHDPVSIQLLRRNGVDMEANMREGIDSGDFARLMKQLMRLCWNRMTSWVTFHGFYDLGYLVKILTGSPLPEKLEGFLELLGQPFPRLYDVKVIAKYCDGLLGGELGLERLAKIMEVERVGGSHQSGSDNLLTGSVFRKMKRRYGFQELVLEGALYGLKAGVSRRFKVQQPRPVAAVPMFQLVQRRLMTSPPSHCFFQLLQQPPAMMFPHQTYRFIPSGPMVMMPMPMPMPMPLGF